MSTAKITNPQILDHQVARHLKPYVRSIVGYAEPDGVGMYARQMPTTIISLILVTGQGFRRQDGWAGARELASSFVAGVHQRPVTIASDGGAVCVQVDLYPSAAHRILGLDMGAVRNTIVDVADLHRHRYQRLHSQLARATAWPDRFAIVDLFLTDALGKRGSELADWAVRRIVSTRGTARIDQLATDAGCSRKHLSTVFRQTVGVSPKALSRIARFEHAFDLASNSSTPLADIAIAAGYADQAHMTRDFTAFAESTPHQARASTTSPYSSRADATPAR